MDYRCWTGETQTELVENVAYEDWHGHDPDRDLLELLRRY